MLDRKKSTIAIFLFSSLFFILSNFVAPHQDGQYRLPKIYFMIFAYSPFIAYCLINDARWRPFYLFFSFAFLTVLRFQFKWSFFTLEIFFLWLMCAAALERIDYEDSFLMVLYVVSVIWIIHGAMQWFNIDPTTKALDPVTRLVNTAVADPVIAFVGNPTWFGATTGMAIPLVLLMRGGIFVAAGLFAVTVMSDSSGGILTAITGISLMIFFKVQGRKKYLFLLGLAALLLAVYFLYPMRPIYGSGGWFDENFRFRAWKDGLEFTRQVKWTGWGLGSWLEIFPRITAKDYHGAVWLQAHSEYIQNYFETGIIGMLFFLWVAINILLSKPTSKRAYHYLAALLAISVNALVSFPWHLPITAIMTLVCLNKFFYYSEKRSMIKLVLDMTRRVRYGRPFKGKT